jgi:DNA-directed RNA polymerase subunit RPC12/RpoP
MRYDYKCDHCGQVREVRHLIGTTPEILCQCGERMRIAVRPPSLIHVTGPGLQGRSLLSRDRPSNEEYRAYKEWEQSGGEDGPERDAFLRAKGEL